MPTPPDTNALTLPALDRLAGRRVDARWIEANRRAPESRWLVLDDLRVPVAADRLPRLLVADDAERLRRSGATEILLGALDGSVYFALDITPVPAARRPPALADATWHELRPLAPALPPELAALLAQARGLIAWHDRQHFCGRCGAPTEIGNAGHIRRCTSAACGEEHFPRTDPAVIALVTRGDACLLANGAPWAPTLYSTLAGFVEPGESLEDAVRREVREETGVLVGAMRYHSSQPWPFPRSLMLGFVAEASSEEIAIDPGELRDARWFTRAELRDAVRAGRVTLSSPVSIARRLVEEWLADGD